MAERRFDVVVFDWDGTLVDSTAHIAAAILQAADDLGIDVPDRGQAAHVIGLGMLPALARVVPDLPQARIPEYIARYQAHYLAAEDRIDLFDGALVLLDALRASKARLAIATGKSRAGLGRALKQSGLEGHFEAVRCADQTHPKPHPAMLEELAEELDAERPRMLMIGDTTHDMQMAASAGVPAVAVSYGAHARVELERSTPLAVVDSMAELGDWLRAQGLG